MEGCHEMQNCYGTCQPYLMDFVEIFTSGRYQEDMEILKILASNISEFQFFLKKIGKLVLGVP